MAEADHQVGVTESTPHPEAKYNRLLYTMATVVALLPLMASFAFSLNESDAPSLSVTQRQPSLVFNEYLIHFGERPVPAQPVISPTFLFRNVGTETIQLQKLIPSCGCLTPVASTMEVAPGESGRLVLPIRTAGESPGFHEYTVNVRYTDPEPREVTLAVKLVLPEHAVLVEPKALFLMGKFSEDLSHEVRVTDLRDDALSVNSVVSSVPWLSPQIVQQTTDEEGTRALIGVRVTGEVPAGNQRAIVHVLTNDAQFPILQVPVVIRVRERPPEQQVTVNRELVNMEASVAPKQIPKVDISFPASWKLSHVEAFPLELAVQFTQPEATESGQQRLRLQLSLSQLPATALQHGVISIVLNEGAETISVPVQFVWSTAALDAQL